MKDRGSNGAENKKKILIVDDHTVVRQGLAELINHEPDLLVLAQAEDAKAAMRAIEREHIDLAIVDISLVGVGGIQLTEQIKMRHPHLPVLILTMHDELFFVRRAFGAGANGYILKRDATELIKAVRLLLAGAIYISPEVARKLSANGPKEQNDS